MQKPIVSSCPFCCNYPAMIMVTFSKYMTSRCCNASCDYYDPNAYGDCKDVIKSRLKNSRSRSLLFSIRKYWDLIKYIMRQLFKKTEKHTEDFKFHHWSQ